MKLLAKPGKLLEEVKFVVLHIYLLGKMMQAPTEESTYDPRTWKCSRCQGTLTRQGICPRCDAPRR